MCDSEEPVSWNESTVRARKEYECYDCGHVIARGETCVVLEGLYRDTGWSRFRVHECCYEWRKAHHKWMRERWDDDCGAQMGGLVAALWEAHHDMHKRSVLRRVG